MEEEHKQQQQPATSAGNDVREVIHEVIREFVTAEQAKAEPAHKTELAEERRRREQLERRVNELVEENQRSRQAAEEAERHSAVREELQRLGVTKVDLGFRVVKDDIYRSAEGRLMARTEGGDVSMQEYLAKFTTENPELLPARISGGSGAASQGIAGQVGGKIDLDRIKPGMDPEELAKARRDIAEAVSQSFRNG